MNALAAQLDGLTLVIGIGLLAAAIALLFMLATALSGDQKRMRRRLARVGGDKGPAMAGGNSPTLRRETVDSSFKSLDKLIKRLPQPAKFRARLAATGRKISPGEYLLACLVVGGATYEALNLFAWSMPVSILVAIGAAVLLPHMLVGFMIKRRILRFIMLLPEAIDLIVRGLRSGLPITESMKVVGQEIPDPVGTEFRRIIESFGVGMTLEEALWATAKRIAVAEFNFFVISLSVQQETGGNLTETLDNLADILRRRKQMKLKIRAITGEARASAAILGAMPFAMFGILMLVRPEYMTVMMTTHQGKVMMGMGLFSIAIGIGTMIKMTKFEI
jgi:tight adherence protein B